MKRREFIISVSRRSDTSAYSGCERLMWVLRSICAELALGGRTWGASTMIGGTVGGSVPNLPHLLGALPAMYATALSSESCSVRQPTSEQLYAVRVRATVHRWCRQARSPNAGQELPQCHTC